MPTMASPRSRETRAMMSASSKCVVASTIAFARLAGSPLLKMPRADEHAVAAELHHERGVRGRRDAAGREVHDRQLAVLGDPLHELVGRLQVLRGGEELLAAQALRATRSRR